jgi:cyclopropane-fatty-acyl-phospholipid synthase
MKAVNLSSEKHLSATPKPGMLDGLARRLVLKQLTGLERGCLELVDGEERFHFGEARESAELAVRIRVTGRSFYGDIAFGGSVGAGEAYMRGAWECSDLVSLVRILLRNRQVLENMELGAARLTQPLQKLFHWINRNTRPGARRNIAAHYDLGNEFFALWLDESMMYSSAIFTDPSMSLAAAQRHRLEEVCERLELRPKDHVIEIGTGWGGFAIHAARNHGCRVTTTTISREQYELAAQRVREAGLEDRITLLREDYRDLDGRYDKLVSIEMIEAIGHGQYDSYFRKCSELLKPCGRLLIQAITIADGQYEHAKHHVDFIKRRGGPGHGLPGGVHPHVGVLPHLLRGRIPGARHKQRAPGSGKAGQMVDR